MEDCTEEYRNYINELLTVYDGRKPLTFEEIQTAFGIKSKDGYTAEVKALITRFGAKKLSEIDAADYPALMKELEAIGNA